MSDGFREGAGMLALLVVVGCACPTVRAAVACSVVR